MSLETTMRSSEHADKTPSYLGQMVYAVLNEELFPDPTSRRVFEEWCRRNDHIRPIFSADNPEGALTHECPDETTLHLSETTTFEQGLVAALEIINDTYADAPEMRAAMGEKFRQALVGDAANYQAASQYFAVQAEAQTNETVQANLRDYAKRFGEIARALDPEIDDEDEVDIAATERWLLGDEVYEKRTGENSIISADRRAKTIARIFSYDGIKNPGYDGVGTLSYGQVLLAQKTADSIRSGLRAANPLSLAVRDRGVDMLANQIAPPELELSDYETLVEHLQLEVEKAALDEIRASGDSPKISAAERRVASKILNTMLGYTYKDIDSPSQILDENQLNCLGATTVITRLLSQLDIDSYGIAIPEHSMFAIRTHGGIVYFGDATGFNNYYQRCTNRYSRQLREIPPEQLGTLGDINQAPQLMRFSQQPHPSFDKDRHGSIGPSDRMLYASAHNNLGAVYSDQGDYEAGILCSQEAIRVNPEDASAHNNLGAVYGDQGDYEAAIPYLRKAIRLNPAYIKAHYNLGVVYRDTNRRDLAIASFRRAALLEPRLLEGYQRFFPDIYDAIASGLKVAE
jgi:tetratricopeptide (TPR) repeat protein